jgi:hypothetical protein
MLPDDGTFIYAIAGGAAGLVRTIAIRFRFPQFRCDPSLLLVVIDLHRRCDRLHAATPQAAALGRNECSRSEFDQTMQTVFSAINQILSTSTVDRNHSCHKRGRQFTNTRYVSSHF